MANSIPDETIAAFARSIHREAHKYGFGQIDTIRLINALMDLSADRRSQDRQADQERPANASPIAQSVDSFPLKSRRLLIRLVEWDQDRELLERWMNDAYGEHFLLSCATAQQHEISAIVSNPQNEVGIITLLDGSPIGAVAYLDIDASQRRAELRKLIGAGHERGKGYAEEATSLWIAYGLAKLGLEKIFVSTLQTHLRNIQLNESVGFRVEGVLRAEVLIEGMRYDVLRMGLCA